jgi:PQQ-dependent catabolism-associated CXXCW motif protein
MSRIGQRAIGAAALLLCCHRTIAALAAPVAEPDGFRMEDYRAPVPDSLTGASVVHTAALQVLLASGHPILIDVLPAPRRPPEMAPGTPWLPLPRRDIPGSLWLPDVGRGALVAAMDEWFRSALRRATDGDRARPIVFYCLADCWMSWNAAKRALTYGYTRVVWYPDGTDGWAAAGLPLAEAKAEALPGTP